MELLEWGDRLLSLVFPKRCVLCGQVVEYERWTCTGCRIATPHCEGQLPFGGLFFGPIAPLTYQAAENVLKEMKERPLPRAATFFAREMAGLIRSTWDGVAFDAVVPVPHKEGEGKGGYHHAQYLAEQVCKLLEAPLLPRALARLPHSKKQSELTHQQRLDNALASYILGPEGVRGKVLLVDDIVTTGATANACAWVLKKAGAEEVYIVAAAATEHRGESPYISGVSQ